MLRALVVVLLLANLLALAWTQGALDGLLGRRPEADREPQRLQRQVNPELVKLLSPAPAAPASAASGVAPPASSGTVALAAGAGAAAAPQCLEAGPLPAAGLAAAEKALAAAGVTPGSWVTTASERKGVFLIYMGRYEDDEALQKKLEEVKRRRIDAQPVRHAELQPGIEVGRFDDKEAAEAALARLSQRGLRTARVLTLVPPQPQLTLRLPQADPAQAPVLATLKLGPTLSGFSACAPAAASTATATTATAASAASPAAVAVRTSASAPAPAPPRRSASTPAVVPAASPAATPARAAPSPSASSAP